MANEVKILFTGDAGQLFALTDQVEQRLRRINGAIDSNPVMAAQVANTQRLAQATAQSGAQRIAAEQAVTRAVSSEIDKQIAAKRKAVEPVQQRKPFDPGDPAVIAERDAKRAAIAKRVNADILAGEKQSAELANQFRRRQFQERIAQGAQESRILTAQLAQRTAAIQAGETAATAVVVKESTKRAAARRASLAGAGQGLSQVGGALGIPGLSALGAGAIAGAGLAVAGAINFGKDAAESYVAANRRLLELRASLEGLGQDYRKVGADAAAFAEKHNLDITAINGRYAEFVKLAQQQGAAVDEVGRKAIDIASKRQLSDTQLAEGLAKIRAGIADESILGAAASTVMLEYAAAHGKTVEALTAAEKQQAVYNEFVRQGMLASGDARTQTTGLATATTQLGNAWEKVNLEAGKYIERLVNSPVEIPKLLLPGGFLFLENTSKPVGVDPKAKQEAEAARQAAVAKNKADLERAVSLGGVSVGGNYRDNIVSLALRQFVNQQQFLSNDPDVADKAKTAAVVAATEYVNTQVKQYKQMLTGAARDIGQTQTLLRNFASIRNFIDPADYKAVTDEAARNLNGGFRDMIQSAGQDVARLRGLLGRVRLTPELLIGDRADLARSISSAIDQAVEAGKAKIDQVRSSILSAFDSVTQLQGARNPYVRIYSEADQRLQQLRDNTRGFSADIRKQMEGVVLQERNVQLFGQRMEGRLGAFDLQEQARQFRRGFAEIDPSKDPTLKFYAERIKLFEKINQEQGGLTPAAEFQAERSRQIVEQRQKEIEEQQKREEQNRLEQQIRIAGGIGARQVLSGFIGGGNLPPSPVYNTEFGPNLSLGQEQQRISNQAIINATRGQKPEDLPEHIRNAAAAAREQEATAILRGERDAQSVRIRQVELLTEIDKRLQALATINEGGGVEAINRIIGDKGLKVDLQGQAITEIEVRSRDLDASKRDQARRPTGAATKAAMEP